MFLEAERYLVRGRERQRGIVGGGEVKKSDMYHINIDRGREGEREAGGKEKLMRNGERGRVCVRERGIRRPKLVHVYCCITMFYEVQ